MDAGRQSVRVSIFNQTYTVSANSGEEAAVEDLARQVDELMSRIARSAGNLDTVRTAVLACLHLADRLHATELELEALKTSISGKSRDFALLLDNALQPERN